MAVFQIKPSQKPHKNFYAYYRKDLTRIRYKRRKPPAVTIYRGNFAPKKFTGKEQDQETGLYYFGARYLDPKTSRWLSTDPALGDYLPVAPNNDDAKKHNQNLPGMGGVFNVVNLHVYHYAGNNPVKYVDPTGMWVDNEDGTFTAEQGDTLWDLYGTDWQEKSGYTGDPSDLQIGQVVGFPDSASSSPANAPSPLADALSPPMNASSNFSRGENIGIGVIEMVGGLGFVVGGVALALALATEGGAIEGAYALGMIGVTLFAFGFARTAGGHDGSVTDDLLNSIPEPLSTYGRVYSHMKEKNGTSN